MVDRVNLELGTAPKYQDRQYIKLPELPVADLPEQPVFNNNGLGSGKPEPELPNIEPERTPATMLETLGGSMFSHGVSFYNAYKEKFVFDIDPDYTVADDIDKYVSLHGVRDPKELEFLSGAKSKEAFEHRVTVLEDEKYRQEVAGDNPWTAFGGSLLDVDLPVSLASAGLGSAVKAPLVAQRAIAASTAVGAMGGIAFGAGDGSTLSTTDRVIDTIAAGIGAPFAIPNPAKSKPTKVTNALDDSVERELEVVNGVPEVTTRTVPEAPVEVPARVKVPLSDYNIKTQINVGKGSMRIIEDAPESRFQIKFKLKGNELHLDGITGVKGLDAKALRLEAYEYGMRYATDNNLVFKFNTQDVPVIKPLTQRGYTIDGDTLTPPKLTVEEVQSIADEVTPEVLALPEGVEATRYIPVDKGQSIPLSRPQYDKDGKPLIPKWSSQYHTVAATQSIADEVFFYTQDLNNPLNKLVSSPAYTQGDDAASLARRHEADGDRRLVEFEEAVEKAAVELHGTSKVWGRKSHTEAMRTVSMDAYEEMQRIDSTVVNAAKQGVVITDEQILKHIDSLDQPEPIKDIMRKYIESGFAVTKYDEAVKSGLITEETAKAVTRRSTYMPVNWMYTRMRLFMDNAGDLNAVGRYKAVAQFIGNQIAKNFEHLTKGIVRADGTTVRISPEDLGKRFIENAKERENPSSVRTTGVARDEIVDILKAQGIDEEEAIQLSVKLTAQGTRKPSAGNWRERITWDWNAKMTTPDGVEFGMRDLIDNAPMNMLNDYNRRMSKRTSLAQYGFPDRASIDTAIMDVVDKLPKGVDRKAAHRFLSDVADSAMGNPVGESLPAPIRSLNTVAGSMLLAWSGMYNVVEAGLQMWKLGLARSIPHMLPAMKPMLRGMKGYTVSQAKDLESTITGLMMTPDRWKRIFTHYSDDFDVTNSFHESVQYYGQSTRFLNGSEFVKRYQIGMYASIVTKAFKGAASGSKGDLKFLSEGLRMSDELTQKVIEQTRKYGDNIDEWNPDVRIAMEQKVLHEGDNLALALQYGEVPKFLEHSAWGKMVFPFMRFVWGAHNKILRRTYVRDGAVAAAMVLAVQFPLAVMVTQLKRATSGEEPYDLDNKEDLKDFIRNSATAMSGLGLFSLPIDLILSEGRNLGSVATFAPVTKTFGLASEAFSEDGVSFRDIKENSVLNTALPFTLAMMAFAEED